MPAAVQRDPSTAFPFNLPPALATELRELLGTEFDALHQALSADPPVSIRINPAKPVDPGGQQVPWCAAGRYLNERPSFTLDPYFHAGCYYVQEASSMMIEQAFNASGLTGQDILALDLCAAPGGKSSHLRTLLTPASLLVSNEPDGSRRQVLLENTWKWGHANVIVTGGPAGPNLSLPGIFDLIIVDAPCSGEGMMRRDPFARVQWSPALVKQCARDQQEILDSAWMALRPGGSLIYCTCTWERAENERQMERMIHVHQAEHVVIPLQDDLTVVVSEPGLRCYPHRLRGEGFYLCLLRKPGLWADHERPKVALQEVGPGERAIVVHAGVRYLLDAPWHHMPPLIDHHMKVVSAGIPLSSDGLGTPVPHAAAAYNATSRAVLGIEELEVDRGEALRFLRGEVIRRSAAKGWRLVTFEGHGLGWVKGAGDRWNNHLPKPWRIRKR